MKELLKSLRVMLMIVLVAFSLLLVFNIIPVNKEKGKGIGFGNGLDYGLDFAGGTQLQLRLERPVDSNVMAIEKSILENRLNSLGLKDIPVRPWGSQYILIQIAGATPTEITRIEEVLRRQARFEERIDGELAVLGDEVSVDLSSTGQQIYKSPGGYSWAVSVSHSPEGACRFGKVAEGKKGRPVDIFIDRPANTTILMYEGKYNLLENVSASGEGDSFYFGDTAIDLIEVRAQIPVVVLGEINQTIEELKSKGNSNVILAGDESRISDSVRNLLEESGFSTVRNEQGNISYDMWISELTGLESSPRLNFDTLGKCVYNAQITGGASTLELAQNEVKTNQVLLTSGNLPAKATVESKSTTPPTVGGKFLRYAFFTGVMAFVVVALIIFLRYRRLSITLPIIITGLSEIILILGLASLINWELDLPAVGGIIASVGTGVDHLIVITDETLKTDRKKRVLNFSESLRRAFFIIFTAAATMIAAMLPMLSIGAGMLKGFAFTTIMGVFVGVIIARPVYAKMIQELLKKSY
ncbi:MAG: hypothetical protein V1921_00475 [Candidatus Altiarchaeota archaeon]